MSTLAATNKSSRSVQLLNDLCTTSSSSKPSCARENIFFCLVPVNGIDNRLETVLYVPDCSSKGVTSVVCGDGESVQGWREW